MNFCLIDSNNLFFRSKYANRSVPIDLRIGLSLNIYLNSLLFINKKFNPDHFVIVSDSKSWRNDFYKFYKNKRRDLRLKRSPSEIEEDEKFFNTHEDILNFFDEKTNLTVLKKIPFESDDLISFWIKKHMNDNHIIVSTDSDFYQLLRYENVKIFDGVKNLILTKNKIVDLKNKEKNIIIKSDGKISLKNEKNSSKNINKEKNKELPDDWYEWCSFLKIIRGDIGDGITGCCSRIRTNLLKKIYEDKKTNGFNWINFLEQETYDIITEKNVKIKELYNRNKILIDLNSQPENIKKAGYEYIEEKTKNSKKIKDIGFNFLKFCKKYDLERIKENIVYFGNLLSKSYEK